MAYKIVLDPGHGGNDTGAVFSGRQEKTDSLRLALAVGDILEQSGVDVAYTRTTDVYHTPFERAEMANNNEADYYISFHRNIMPEPNTASGVETYVFREDSEAGDLAKHISQSLMEIGFTNLGTMERPSLVVLRKTRMPAVWIEAGYIDNIQDNEFFDANFDSIAAAIADSILRTLNQGEGNGEPAMLYRVQVGAFRSRALANQLLTQLQQQGFPAFLGYEDGFIKVQVGVFNELDQAVEMEQTLRNYGYNTFITTQ